MAGWASSEPFFDAALGELQVTPEDPPNRPQDATFLLMPAVPARAEAETRQQALAMGSLGGVFALLVGMTGGWASASRVAVLKAGAMGLVSGSILGIGLSLLLFPLFYRFRDLPPDPMLPFLCHAAAYTALGGFGGLAFGYGAVGVVGAFRGLASAAMGALVGSMFYDLLHAFLLPLEWDFYPVPGSSGSRLMILLSVSLSSAVCSAAVLAGSNRGHSASVQPREVES